MAVGVWRPRRQDFCRKPDWDVLKGVVLAGYWLDILVWARQGRVVPCYLVCRLSHSAKDRTIWTFGGWVSAGWKVRVPEW